MASYAVFRHVGGKGKRARWQQFGVMAEEQVKQVLAGATVAIFARNYDDHYDVLSNDLATKVLAQSNRKGNAQ